MITGRERFIVDEEGKRTEVILDVEDYYRMLQELEGLESVRAFDLILRRAPLKIVGARRAVPLRTRTFSLSVVA